jgi:hypothetical protein
MKSYLKSKTKGVGNFLIIQETYLDADDGFTTGRRTKSQDTRHKAMR